MNQACIPITIESSFSVRPFHFLKIWAISIPKSKTIHVPILRGIPIPQYLVEYGSPYAMPKTCAGC